MISQILTVNPKKVNIAFEFKMTIDNVYYFHHYNIKQKIINTKIKTYKTDESGKRDLKKEKTQLK